MHFSQTNIRRIERLLLLCACDKDWDESKHPRAENGQFGKGTGSAKKNLDKEATKIPSVTGKELGNAKDLKDLRTRARLYAIEHFSGKKFVNLSTGNEIQVGASGIKHTISGAAEDLIKTIPAIPGLIETATLIHKEKDKRGDPNVLSVEIYKAEMNVMGRNAKMILTVKHYKDGRRYYDHGYMRE